jgi:hypothetical protein
VSTARWWPTILVGGADITGRHRAGTFAAEAEIEVD